MRNDWLQRWECYALDGWEVQVYQYNGEAPRVALFAPAHHAWTFCVEASGLRVRVQGLQVGAGEQALACRQLVRVLQAGRLARAGVCS